MKPFVKNSGPHMKDDIKTKDIMNNVLIALLPIILFGILKNGVMPYLSGYGEITDMLKPLMVILTSVLTSTIIEYLWFKYVKKEKNIEVHMKNSYFLLPPIFLALILPLNTPLFVVAIGAAFATTVTKLLFGGFGHNIFNPALTGRLFVIGSYYGLITENGGFLNLQEVDAVTTATPLANMATNGYIESFETLVAPYGSLLDFITGLIPGSIAETSAALIVLALIYLLSQKVITWQIPITYIGTVFLITFAVGTYYDLGIWYPLFHILSGGLLFGAVFMATDPVTSPSNPTSQVLYGISLGILTVVFRFIGLYPEGVLSAILTMNMLVIIYDKIGSRGRVDKKKLITPIITLVTIVILVTIAIINEVKPIDETTTEPETDSNFIVHNITKEENKTIYNVEHKGFHGLIKSNITIENNEIIEIEIISQNESVWSDIKKSNYINSLIENQSNLDNLDAVSGATWTSNYLKQMIEKTLNTQMEESKNEE